MKNKGLLVALGVILILVFWGCGQYNGLVNKDEDVKGAWGKVQSAYQERADLVPNLVNTVKGAANFEQETLTKVIEARAKATAVTVNAGDLTPEKMAQFQQAQGELSSALSRLMVTVEKYPDLKANQNFLQLQSKLEGIENGIKGTRDAYTGQVNIYNKKVRSFPLNMVAGMFGFTKKTGFEADKGAEKAPEVKF
ncbi:MAG: LemA family protein [Dinghuibacter sp.]|nr:LemA family protein [Dinghuibacter sp.]